MVTHFLNFYIFMILSASFLYFKNLDRVVQREFVLPVTVTIFLKSDIIKNTCSFVDSNYVIFSGQMIQYIFSCRLCYFSLSYRTNCIAQSYVSNFVAWLLSIFLRYDDKIYDQISPLFMMTKFYILK